MELQDGAQNLLKDSAQRLLNPRQALVRFRIGQVQCGCYANAGRRDAIYDEAALQGMRIEFFGSIFTQVKCQEQPLAANVRNCIAVAGADFGKSGLDALALVRGILP